MKDKSALLYLENQLCFPLYAASRLTTKIYSPYLKKLNITYPQYIVMLVLWQYNEQSVKEIGERLFLESNTLTPLLKRLEIKKLIKRRRSKEDERTVLVSLSSKGNKLKEEVLFVPVEIMESFQNSSIKEKELKTFQETLINLVGILANKATAGQK
ncbi:MarR family winged helix-turn-helix transcriptional regulator [Membranihabitans maritimus]|uniref:MarR family winged helix-turn-helix transcriptional regulator n=1 Tax=Membranihabitans maritimus TaxID=2904244 RepID=UPI001F186712|nr:MarR family transcriptional regulator [Membranihabitans maritimus]